MYSNLQNSKYFRKSKNNIKGSLDLKILKEKKIN